jgi:hypothetical protein
MRIILGLVILSLSGVAFAQTSAGSSSAPETALVNDKDEIVVEGPPAFRERRRELRQFTSELLKRPRPGLTIGTYFSPICPKVFGIPEEQATVIEKRIRDNAAALGANRRNLSDDCKNNASVIFVSANKGTADQWMTTNSDLLDHLLLWQRQRVLSEQGPVRAWSYSGVRGFNGERIASRPVRGLGSIADAANKIPFASRLSLPISVEVTGSVVMIELAQANGKTLTQLADYATMRTLANTNGLDPQSVPAAPTILTLFQDEDAPAELTQFDRSLISGLYSTTTRGRENRFYSRIAHIAAKDEAATLEISSAP